MDARSIVNLTVHGIGATERELEPGEQDVWLSVERFEEMLDIVAWRPDVRLTFDDGNRSDVEIALPRLLELGLTAQFFVLAGRLGEPGRLDRSDVRALADAGMSIGSHGWAHRDWRRLAADETEAEFEAASRLLSELVGRPVPRVAVPFGCYDRAVLRRLRQAGVERVYTSDGGRTRRDRWLQGRTSLRSGTDPAAVRALVDGSESRVAPARQAVTTFVKRNRGPILRSASRTPVRGTESGTPETTSASVVTPTVAAVIVTFNSAAQLPSCLAALAHGTAGVRLAEVVVADNASSDDSTKVAEEFTALPVRVVRLGRNRGYAAAINAAIDSLDRDGLTAVLVLNPDVQVRQGAIATLAGALRRPRTGIAVPRLINPDGTLQPSLRREPTLARAAVEALIGGRRAGRLGELILEPDQYERVRPATWATGAAMLISVDVVRDVGSWDESFLLYSEETDYALRAGDRGWQLWYAPEAVMEHSSGDAYRANPVMAALATVNRVRVFRKRHGPLASAAYHSVVTVGELLRAARGRRTSRAALMALLRPSRRLQSLPG